MLLVMNFGDILYEVLSLKQPNFIDFMKVVMTVMTYEI